MRNDSEPGPIEESTWPPAFRGGLAPPVAFLAALVVLVVASNIVVSRLSGPGTSEVSRQLLVIFFDVLTIALVVLVLRHERVQMREIGLDTALLTPAVVAFGGLVVALNGLVLAAGLFGTDGVTVDFLYDHSGTEIAVRVVSLYVFAALAEELAIRGYLQNKLVSLLDGGSLRTVIGIAAASIIFALIHVPRYVVAGHSIEQQLPALALLLFTGIGFGLIYEATRNLCFVTLVHGLGNYWLLVVEPASWPNWPLVVGLYVLVVLSYRRWLMRPSHAGNSDVTVDR